MLSCAQWMDSLHTPLPRAAGAGGGTRGPSLASLVPILKALYCDNSSSVPTQAGGQHPEA